MAEKLSFGGLRLAAADIGALPLDDYYSVSFGGLAVSATHIEKAASVSFSGLGVSGDINIPVPKATFSGLAVNAWNIVNRPPSVSFGGIGLQSPEFRKSLVFEKYDFEFSIIGPKKTSYEFGFDIYPRTYKSYAFEFLAGEIIVSASYPFTFDVLTVAQRADFAFQIVEPQRWETRYSPFEFLIKDTIQTKKEYNVSFWVRDPRVSYGPFEFDITPANLYYGFEFQVATPKKVVYDVEYDVVESWVPVTLTCNATPRTPGTLTPSDVTKHRLTIKAFSSTGVLIGSGSCVFQWKGPGSAHVALSVEPIPQLSADTRIAVYDNAVRVLNVTEPASEVWNGSYGNA